MCVERFKILRFSKYVKDVSIMFLCVNLRYFERKFGLKSYL